jgi:cytochrome oxidase Cu insertion factor (SCO1/SenC/PrrC family)
MPLMCPDGGGGPRSAEPVSTARSMTALIHIELQNQDGICANFEHIFGGRASVIAFFYTRCMNPEKCSRTISKLAQVHKLVGRRDSNAVVAGITYDPEYDIPERLRRYGADRGIKFADSCQLLRSIGSFIPIRDALHLNVGYGAATVNRHAIELIFVDAAGTIVGNNVRRLFDEGEVADALLRMDTDRARVAGRTAAGRASRV